MKNSGFNGYVSDFSVDYGATDTENIKGIHRYFIKKNDIV